MEGIEAELIHVIKFGEIRDDEVQVGCRLRQSKVGFPLILERFLQRH